MTRWLARLASAADVRVLPVVGAGGRAAADDVPLLSGVRVVTTPRAANLLLVIGRITPALLRPLLTVHDQLPTPRATVWWPVDADGDDKALRSAMPHMVVTRANNGADLRSLFAELVNGARNSDPPSLPDEEPADWRGVGPFGQGGTGMTGGVPFGRPLAGRAPDPDGLELDQLPLHVGPMFPPFPPGLVLDIQLQGDVIREVTVGENPFLARPHAPVPPGLDTAVFLEALTTPQLVATLEVARARHHLRWAARALCLHGLEGDALRLLALARSLEPEPGPAVAALAPTVDREQRTTVETLARRLRRHRTLSWATRRVGVVVPEHVNGGPVARAAGVAADARLEDPGYDGIDFSLVVHEGGDARARLLQRLAEAGQALDLAQRAGSRLRQPGPPLEGPRGPLVPGEPLPSSALLGILPGLLVGQEWGDAMTTVASLDLDLEEAAVGQRAAAPA